MGGKEKEREREFQLEASFSAEADAATTPEWGDGGLPLKVSLIGIRELGFKLAIKGIKKSRVEAGGGFFFS